MTGKTKKILKNTAIWTVILFVILSICGGAYILRYSLTNPYHQDYSLSTELDSMAARNPEIASWLDSIRHNSSLRDTFITAADGVRLHALFVNSATPTTKTAFLIHGYTDDATMMLNIGHIYNARLGFNIFLPDLRAHGLSEGGDVVGMGWTDMPDIHEWLKLVKSMYSDSARVVVHGFSMGGATTVNLAGDEPEEFRDMIRCYVEDCGYTSVWDEFACQLKEQFSLPTFPLLYSSSALCRLCYGWSFGEASSLERAKNIRKPIFFIHGGDDSYVPTRMGKQLYDACQSEKLLWIPEGVKHAKSYRNNPDEYFRRVNDFVSKHINNSSDIQTEK